MKAKGDDVCPQATLGKTHLPYSAARSPSQPGLPGPTQGHTRGSGERVTDTGAATWNNTENESRVVGLTHWMTHFLAQGCSEHPPRATPHPPHTLCSLFAGKPPPPRSPRPHRERGAGCSDLPLLPRATGGQLENPFFNLQNSSPHIMHFEKEQVLPWKRGENLDSFCPFPDYNREPCTP